MLKNLWYVACLADELDQRPRAARMLGHDFVLFRSAEGAIACLADTCVHRGAPLSQGRCVAAGVQCPYHGWVYGHDGRCVQIPALGQDARIPERARVDAYPVAERFGLVWVFLGDLADRARPAIPDFLPEYLDADGWAFLHGRFDYAANWERVFENHIDSAHTHFIHADFGNPDDPRVPTATVHTEGLGAWAEHSYKPRPKRGPLGQLLDEHRPMVRTRLAFDLGGMGVRLAIRMTETMRQVVFQAFTPVDDTHCISHYIQARNFLTEPEHDASMRADLEKIFTEDRQILERLRPVLAPESPAGEVSVGSDALPAAFRQQVRRWRSAHGRVRSPDRSGIDSISAIASPARSGSGGWVFPSA
ncbi:MAG: aromatic ring-hydroxylating dioxygenase subunit alpha [Gammaproteobacteria bacterium]|nr:aromatic ring-hydroxylating dioxygenase subunit alpha [Gammaproteobacteria bacterium]